MNDSGKKFLIDANIIIDFQKCKADASQETINNLLKNNPKLQDFIDLLRNESVALAITPLIRYEVLRGEKNQNARIELQAIIDNFDEFDIDKNASELAADIYMIYAQKLLENDKNAKPDKRSFDILHFASAKCNQLELCSNDKEMNKYEEIFNLINNRRELEK